MNPISLMEGALLAGFAIGAHVGYIYIRGEFYQEAMNILKRLFMKLMRQGFWEKMPLVQGGTLTFMFIGEQGLIFVEKRLPF
jgi:NADH:ubiquinone oxidoreductase subunit F (NADH-binding)